jgi:sec-independent protein translocase protein TatA
MPNIGPLELIVVLVIALVVLGPKKLPDMGRSVGRGMREFKDAISGSDHDHDPAPEAELPRPREVERKVA